MTKPRGAPVEHSAVVRKHANRIEECQAALKEGRFLLVGLQGAGADLSSALKGAREFQASADLPRSVIVEFSVDDAGGRGLLRELGRELKPSETIVLLLAPPGILIGTFEGSPTKRDLARALAGVGKCSCGPGCCG